MLKLRNIFLPLLMLAFFASSAIATDFDTVEQALSPASKSFWPLRDANGATSLADLNGNHTITAGNFSNITLGATGILTNDAETSATFASGLFKTAGSADWNIGTGDFTVFWAQKIASAPGSLSVVFSWPNSSGWIGISTAGKLENQMLNAGTAIGANSVCDNATHFIVVKRVSGVMTVKIDNATDATLGGASTTALGDATNPFVFGALDSGADFAVPSAKFEKVGVLLRGTTDAEDTSLYNASITGATSTINIPVTDANWFHSPYTTWSDGAGSLQANNVKGSSTIAAYVTQGAYGHVKVSATGNVALDVDVSRLVTAGVGSTHYPIVSYSLDGGAWTDVQLTSSSTAVDALVAGSVATHDLRYRYKADWQGTDKWTGIGSPAIPADALVVTNLTVDTGASTVALTNRPKRAIFYGDSITDGLMAANNSGLPGGNDACTFNFTTQIASALNAEFGVFGHGGTGYEVASGSAGAPNFPSSWNLQFSGASLLTSGTFTVQPDYIFVFHGTNGSTSQADVAGIITSLRTAAPSAKIFFVYPPTSTNANAATDAAIAAASADKSLFELKPAQSIYDTADGTHLTYTGEVDYGPRVIQLMQAAIGGSGGGNSSGTIIGGRIGIGL